MLLSGDMMPYYIQLSDGVYSFYHCQMVPLVSIYMLSVANASGALDGDSKLRVIMDTEMLRRRGCWHATLEMLLDVSWVWVQWVLLSAQTSAL